MILEQDIGVTWRSVVQPEFEHAYMRALASDLTTAEAEGRQIYPRQDQLYRALELTPLDRVRVVILGQDPYHGPGQAHGLSFSVQPGIKTPGSLRNIYAELERSLAVPPADHGFLEHWARQGVLLLNSVLTVEQGQPNAHKGWGWERFTDAIIAAVNNKPDPVVFMLWGGAAKAKGQGLSRRDEGGRHSVLETSHPSGLSAYRGFRGCDHFKTANARMTEAGFAPIDWRLPPIDR